MLKEINGNLRKAMETQFDVEDRDNLEYYIQNSMQFLFKWDKEVVVNEGKIANWQEQGDYLELMENLLHISMENDSNYTEYVVDAMKYYVKFVRRYGKDIVLNERQELEQLNIQRIETITSYLITIANDGMNVFNAAHPIETLVTTQKVTMFFINKIVITVVQFFSTISSSLLQQCIKSLLACHGAIVLHHIRMSMSRILGENPESHQLAHHYRMNQNYTMEVFFKKNLTPVEMNDFIDRYQSLLMLLRQLNFESNSNKEITGPAHNFFITLGAVDIGVFILQSISFEVDHSKFGVQLFRWVSISVDLILDALAISATIYNGRMHDDFYHQSIASISNSLHHFLSLHGNSSFSRRLLSCIILKSIQDQFPLVNHFARFVICGLIAICDEELQMFIFHSIWHIFVTSLVSTNSTMSEQKMRRIVELLIYAMSIKKIPDAALLMVLDFISNLLKFPSSHGPTNQECLSYLYSQDGNNFMSLSIIEKFIQNIASLSLLTHSSATIQQATTSLVKTAYEYLNEYVASTGESNLLSTSSPSSCHARLLIDRCFHSLDNRIQPFVLGISLSILNNLTNSKVWLKNKIHHKSDDIHRVWCSNIQTGTRLLNWIGQMSRVLQKLYFNNHESLLGKSVKIPNHKVANVKCLLMHLSIMVNLLNIHSQLPRGVIKLLLRSVLEITEISCGLVESFFVMIGKCDHEMDRNPINASSTGPVIEVQLKYINSILISTRIMKNTLEMILKNNLQPDCLENARQILKMYIQLIDKIKAFQTEKFSDEVNWTSCDTTRSSMSGRCIPLCILHLSMQSILTSLFSSTSKLLQSNFLDLTPSWLKSKVSHSDNINSRTSYAIVTSHSLIDSQLENSDDCSDCSPEWFIDDDIVGDYELCQQLLVHFLRPSVEKAMIISDINIDHSTQSQNSHSHQENTSSQRVHQVENDKSNNLKPIDSMPGPQKKVCIRSPSRLTDLQVVQSNLSQVSEDDDDADSYNW